MMADGQTIKEEGDETQWNGVEDTAEDPEELRVIFQALDSFSQYAKTAHLNCTHLRRRAFYAMPQAQWQMLARPPFSYLETLDRTDTAIDSNAGLARAIVQYGLASLGCYNPTAGDAEENQMMIPKEWVGVAKSNDTDKARSSIRQFYRDWSAEGAAERNVCNDRVFRALDAEKVRQPDRTEPWKVLVPGAGLGRLVFDLCHQGYLSEGNEISYHSLLASSYILNHVEHAGQHTIYPWIHTFSNHRNREQQFQSYKIPDIQPQESLSRAQGIGAMQMCAADFLCLYGDDEHKDAYDAVAAVFFLDTAPNLIRYLEVIRHCLKPGGVLINVGPLLWHWENNVASNSGYDGEDDDSSGRGIAEPGSFEFTADEVVALVKEMGFTIEKYEDDIRAPYVQDEHSMLQTVYSAIHFVARKL
ncbi:hypothetical protein PG994_014253 [Apiospora phragmitis]|uniref:carnosine N-methyltransferase n=1 Tax=Apiospora phragmitis TaxID=2905665 RepID=A0ABR1T3T5_9PEZI